jgi:hypothetical protein
MNVLVKLFFNFAIFRFFCSWTRVYYKSEKTEKNIKSPVLHPYTGGTLGSIKSGKKERFSC